MYKWYWFIVVSTQFINPFEKLSDLHADIVPSFFQMTFSLWTENIPESLVSPHELAPIRLWRMDGLEKSTVSICPKCEVLKATGISSKGSSEQFYTFLIPSLSCQGGKVENKIYENRD